MPGYRDYVLWIQSDVQLRPADGRTKVYIIVNAEELREDAADRLLKTIEEPPYFVTFLLTASDRGAVKPTIASRSQEIRLSPLSRGELANELIARELAPADLADRVAALSGGKPGWALTAVSNPDILHNHDAAINTLTTAIGASRLQRLVCARALSDQWPSKRDAVSLTLSIWMTWCRDLAFLQVGLPERMVHTSPGELAALNAIAGQVTPADLRTLQLLIQQSLADLEANVNSRLVLDLLLLKLPLVTTRE